MDMSRVADGTRVEVEIGELVVHGLAHVNAARLGRSVELELGRLLAADGAGAAFAGDVSRLRAPAEIRLSADAGPLVAGAAIARAVFQALPR